MGCREECCHLCLRPAVPNCRRTLGAGYAISIEFSRTSISPNLRWSQTSWMRLMSFPVKRVRVFNSGPVTCEARAEEHGASVYCFGLGKLEEAAQILAWTCTWVPTWRRGVRPPVCRIEFSVTRTVMPRSCRSAGRQMQREARGQTESGCRGPPQGGQPGEACSCAEWQHALWSEARRAAFQAVSFWLRNIDRLVPARRSVKCREAVLRGTNARGPPAADSYRGAGRVVGAPCSSRRASDVVQNIQRRSSPGGGRLCTPAVRPTWPWAAPWPAGLGWSASGSASRHRRRFCSAQRLPWCGPPVPVRRASPCESAP